MRTHDHCFVLRGDTDVLVDAGCGPDRLREVLEAWHPEMVLISHSHPDHCSGAWMLSDARIMSPRERSESFWRFDAQSVRFAGAEMASRWVDFVTEHMGVREFEPDGHFEDGTLFDFGTVSLQCHHAPGHTEDHYVFFEPHHGVAITFDIDLTPFGPWYGHVESSIDQTLAAIEKVIDLKPRMLLSSHKGLVTDDIVGNLRRYAGVVDTRDARITALLNRPKTLDDLVEASPIYGGHPWEGLPLRYWEGQMILKHLERLEERGLAVVQGPPPGAGQSSRFRAVGTNLRTE